jgi:RHS repeat-associated protein
VPSGSPDGDACLPVARRPDDPCAGPGQDGPAARVEPHGSVGGIDDTATGLTHIGAREYDQDSGRFLSADPVIDLADPLQMNGYTYANSSPISKSDPSGLTGGRGSAAASAVGKARGLGCKCFLTGTDVLMADGTTKDIEDVELGDEVLATDPETGETGPRKVTRLVVTEEDKHFNELSIATADGIEKLTATHEHPFWSPSERDWIEAGELTAGMALRTDTGDTVIVTGNRAFTRHARTYNLTVDGLHTYYVLAGATPVLVHNSTCPSFIADQAGNIVALPQIQKVISRQKQDRHILNGNGYKGGGYFNSHADAQAVLDAYHGGKAQVMGLTKTGNIQIRVPGVTGYDNNPRAGRLGVPTNIFMIKGTKSPSVVPMNPSAGAP